ncbi:hypothetical protein [Gulosibacter bifidus]|uniref:Lipoprotein n=1 Tax=Gulosibacter bifidus TaxID=272239 RepID=A0ABW5RJN8_9MICO|nr:hypothetical protein [Gulosibacter bifidus]
MKTLRKLAVIPALAATLTLAACAGGGRPSASDLQDAMKSGLEKQGMTTMLSEDLVNKMTDCMATKLHESDISDESLSKMVEAAKNGEDQVEYKDEAEKKKTEDIITDVSKQCGDDLQDQIMEEMGGGAGGAGEIAPPSN